MADLKSITERIKKLLALSKSPNEHEAATAAAAAARLQAEYQVEQAMLEDSGEVYEIEDIFELVLDPTLRRTATWKGQVRMAVAELNGCETYTKSAGGVVIFGRRSATQTVLYTCQYLYQEIEAISDRAWAEVPLRSESRRTWTNSFRLGCALRIAARIREQIPKRLEGIPEKALAIILKHDKEVKAAWDKLYEERGLRKKSRSRTQIDRDAFNEGATAGDSISIGGQRAALGPVPGRLGSAS